MSLKVFKKKKDVMRSILSNLHNQSSKVKYNIYNYYTIPSGVL